MQNLRVKYKYVNINMKLNNATITNLTPYGHHITNYQKGKNVRSTK